MPSFSPRSVRATTRPSVSSTADTSALARAAARSLTRSTADADDAVAEAFARVLAVMRRGGGPEVAMRPYLMTVVRNVCFDRAKRPRP